MRRSGKKTDLKIETLYAEQKSFNDIIPPKNDLQIILDPIQSGFEWPDNLPSFQQLH